MKHLFFTLLLLLVAVMFATAQTTQEEYNYLTTGYAQDIETGHDIKSGYSLENVYNFNGGENTYKYSLFKETSSDKIKAILIDVMKNHNNKSTYFCLPIKNNDLLEHFRKDYVKKLGSLQEVYFNRANMYFLSWLAGQNFNI